MNYTASAANTPSYSLPSGFTSMANWHHGSVLTQSYLPSPGQPNSTEYSGAGAPTVIYANGIWFMAYSIIIGGDYTQSPGTDIWRIAWAYSLDGANWTQTSLIYIDEAENVQPPAYGAMPQQLYYENGYFYLVFTRLFGNNIYMMRAPFQASPPYYTRWELPTATDANNDFTATAWVQLPDYSTPGQPAVSTLGVVPLIASDSLESALCNNTETTPKIGFAKLYASNSSPNYRYIFMLDLSRSTCGDGRYPLRVFSSPTLERKITLTGANPTLYTDINAGQNLSHVQYKSADLDWKPSFVWLVPNTTYPQPYNPATLFMNSSNLPSGLNHNVGRVQLRLSGDIY